MYTDDTRNASAPHHTEGGIQIHMERETPTDRDTKRNHTQREGDKYPERDFTERDTERERETHTKIDTFRTQKHKYRKTHVQRQD